MDIINSTIKYVIDFAATSESTYHVNPWIFCILFFGSAIPLYYGYYRIARSVIHFEKGKFSKKDIDQSGLRTGVIISCVAWLLPYAYVLVFGRLPLNILVIFITFVVVYGVLFMRTLVRKISKTDNDKP